MGDYVLYPHFESVPMPPRKSASQAATAVRSPAKRSAVVEKQGDSGSERRAAILQVAEKLFASKGISSTTVRDIGEAAGIMSGSLYHHFDSKESMVVEILSDYFAALLKDCEEVASRPGDPAERLAGLFSASFAAINRDPYACEIFQNDFKYLTTLPALADVLKSSDKVQWYWREAIDEGIKLGQFRSDIPARVFYAFARDAVWFTVRWYRPGGRYRIGDVAQDCIEIFMNGFAVAS
jgi:AcrR family transcriptional regulator